MNPEETTGRFSIDGIDFDMIADNNVDIEFDDNMDIKPVDFTLPDLSTKCEMPKKDCINFLDLFKKPRLPRKTKKVMRKVIDKISGKREKKRLYKHLKK